MPDYDEPCYAIGVVGRMLGIPPYMLRHYEGLGLISPSRTPGNIRLYSERDLERLRQIKRLNDLGVNLVSVEIIMRLAERMMEMERRMEQMEMELQDELARLKQIVASETTEP